MDKAPQPMLQQLPEIERKYYFGPKLAQFKAMLLRLAMQDPSFSSLLSGTISRAGQGRQLAYNLPELQWTPVHMDYRLPKPKRISQGQTIPIATLAVGIIGSPVSLNTEGLSWKEPYVFTDEKGKPSISMNLADSSGSNWKAILAQQYLTQEGIANSDIMPYVIIFEHPPLAGFQFPPATTTQELINLLTPQFFHNSIRERPFLQQGWAKKRRLLQKLERCEGHVTCLASLYLVLSSAKIIIFPFAPKTASYGKSIGSINGKKLINRFTPRME